MASRRDLIDQLDRLLIASSCFSECIIWIIHCKVSCRNWSARCISYRCALSSNERGSAVPLCVRCKWSHSFCIFIWLQPPFSQYYYVCNLASKHCLINENVQVPNHKRSKTFCFLVWPCHYFCHTNNNLNWYRTWLFSFASSVLFCFDVCKAILDCSDICRWSWSKNIS